MIYYDIIVWVVKNIQSIACDNYDDFQHVNFVFFTKVWFTILKWLCMWIVNMELVCSTCGNFVALCYYCTQFLKILCEFFFSTNGKKN
jgi:hypothetical protein